MEDITHVTHMDYLFRFSLSCWQLILTQLSMLTISISDIRPDLELSNLVQAASISLINLASSYSIEKYKVTAERNKTLFGEFELLFLPRLFIRICLTAVMERLIFPILLQRPELRSLLKLYGYAITETWLRLQLESSCHVNIEWISFKCNILY